MQAISGLLERITYHNEENDFVIGKLQEKSKKGLITKKQGLKEKAGINARFEFQEVFSVFSEFPFSKAGKIQFSSSWIKPNLPSFHCCCPDDHVQLFAIDSA